MFCSVLQSVAVCCSTCHIDVRDSFFTLINEGHLIQSRVYDLVVVDQVKGVGLSTPDTVSQGVGIVVRIVVKGVGLSSHP